MPKIFCFFLLFSSLLSANSNDKFPNELTTPEYLSLVTPFLPENPNILEAGAHSGEDTIIMAAKWKQGHVFAFEPVILFYERIQKNILQHGLKNVSAYPFGLFTTSGNQAFYYSQNCGGASSFLPDNNLVDYNDITLVLPCKNLDEWANEHQVDHIDLMWLDMEGAEYYVLSSAPEILSTTKVILTEINFKEFRKGSTQYHTLKTFLEEEGFTLYKIWGSPHWQATGLFIRNELVN